MERMKLYEQLVNIPGISGYEHSVRSFVKEELLVNMLMKLSKTA